MVEDKTAAASVAVVVPGYTISELLGKGAFAEVRGLLACIRQRRTIHMGALDCS